MLFQLSTEVTSVLSITALQVINNIEKLAELYANTNSYHTIFRLQKSVCQLDVGFLNTKRGPFLSIIYYAESDRLNIVVGDDRHVTAMDELLGDNLLVIPKEDFKKLFEAAGKFDGYHFLSDKNTTFSLLANKNLLSAISRALDSDGLYLSKNFQERKESIMHDLKYQVSQCYEPTFDKFLTNRYCPVDNITWSEMLPVIEKAYPGVTTEVKDLYEGNLKDKRTHNLTWLNERANKVIELKYTKPALFAALGGDEYSKSEVENIVRSIETSINELDQETVAYIKVTIKTEDEDFNSLLAESLEKVLEDRKHPRVEVCG